MQFDTLTTTRILNTVTITGDGGILLSQSSATIINTGDLLSNGSTLGALHAVTGNAGLVSCNSGPVAAAENDVFRGKSGGIQGNLSGGAGND